MQLSRFCRDVLRGVAPIAVVIVLAGCGTETPSSPEVQGWELVAGQRGRSVVNPSKYLLDAGCRAYSGRGDSGTIAIPLPAGGLARFHCNNVGITGIRRGIVDFHRAVTAAISGTFITSLPGGSGGGYWAYSGQQCAWVAGGQDSYTYQVGNMLYTVVTGWNGYCNWVDEYAWVPSSGGGGPPETGGPGGSPGGTTTVPPTLADSVFIEVGVDAVADTTTPNCPANPTELRAYKWCHPVTMGSTDLQRINAAIQRMAGLGYVCATLAMAIDSVVQAGRLHLFDPEYPHVAFGGFASTGGAGKGFIGLSTAWTRQAWDHDHTGLAAGERMTLQAALAHEADHLLNNTNPVNDEVHLPGSLVLTVHTKACSDVLL